MPKYYLDEELNVRESPAQSGSGTQSGGFSGLTAAKQKSATKHLEALHKIYSAQMKKSGGGVSGAGFLDWLANAGKTLVGMIPGVGEFAKEGISALQEHRKYNFGKAAKNQAINIGTSFLPPGVKQVANAGIKKLTGGKKTRKPRQLSDKQKRRNKAISILVKKHGMKLGEASKYLKENGF
jgi:hypothetical protein